MRGNYVQDFAIFKPRRGDPRAPRSARFNMSKIKKAFYYLFNQPGVLTEELFIRYAKGKNYTDEEYVKKLFFWRKWHRLDLDNPKTFSEKCQWLKL